MPSIAEAIRQARIAQQSGQMARAAEVCRQILAVDPNQAEAHLVLGNASQALGNPGDAAASFRRALELQPRALEAIYNLGTLALSQNNLVEAADCWRRAVELRPGVPQAHGMLATVLEKQGHLDDAVASYQRAIELDPAYAEALNNLGAVLSRQGKLAAAADCWRRVLTLRPELAQAHNNLGTVLEQQDKLDEAAACYRRAVQLKPDFAEAQNNLGATLARLNKPQEAMACWQRAIELEPRSATAYNNLGAQLEKEERLDEAAALYRRLVEQTPNSPQAHFNLGSVLARQHRTDEAQVCWRRAVELDPNSAELHTTIGYALRAGGYVDGAIDSFTRALELDPASGPARGGLASALAATGRTEEALAEYERGLAADPNQPDMLVSYGVCLESQCRLDEAIASYRAAVRLDPNNATYHSNVLYALNHHPDHDAAAIFAEHREWARRHADPLTPRHADHANDRTPGRRLRVGYVSAHFWAHAVNFFSEPILAAHDHGAFEVFCYSNGARNNRDETTQRLHGYADHWREIANQSDEQVCEMIRRDRIDVLVDLTGHIGGNRLTVFARKPAPVQVTYIGYQDTTGMLAMDYRLTDAWSDPPGLTEAFHTEKLVRLPRSFFCYLPTASAPETSPLPATANGFVTFGSFNNPTKITPQVLSTWAEILAAVPGSRLVLLAPPTPTLRRHVDAAFERGGVSPQRVVLHDRRPRADYLKLINRVDIALDPFPFNGHTTTCDCLWMGVPVVALAGDSYASRFGSSALMTLQLSELIATTRERYVAIARDLATDLPRLASLRATLRAKMAASPLVDAVGFTRNLEAAYRQMWSDWCANK